MAFLTSFGTELAIGDNVTASVTTYTAVGQVYNIEPGDWNIVLAETTHHTSPGGWAQQIATGRKEPIELTFDIRYDPDLATHSNTDGPPYGLFYVWTNRVELGWRLTLTDTTPTIFTFDGFISTFSPQIGDGTEAVMANCVLAVNGAITLA